ncbi:hypothetical protein EJB05_36099, partial [Eragrostis curvula]
MHARPPPIHSHRHGAHAQPTLVSDHHHHAELTQDLVALVSMAAASVAVSTSSLCGSGHQSLRPSAQTHRLAGTLLGRPSLSLRRRPQTGLAAAGKKSGEAEEQVPAWARPGADEPPPWAREGGGGGGAQGPDGGQVPFYAYLLASAITAIAAIGSIFEYTNHRPVFGIINADSVLYAPLLGFFVFTGIPTSVRKSKSKPCLLPLVPESKHLFHQKLAFLLPVGFLWYKAVQTANKEAEEQDRRDGFMSSVSASALTEGKDVKYSCDVELSYQGPVIMAVMSRDSSE